MVLESKLVPKQPNLRLWWTIANGGRKVAWRVRTWLQFLLPSNFFFQRTWHSKKKKHGGRQITLFMLLQQARIIGLASADSNVTKTYKMPLKFLVWSMPAAFGSHGWPPQPGSTVNLVTVMIIYFCLRWIVCAPLGDWFYNHWRA